MVIVGKQTEWKVSKGTVVIFSECVEDAHLDPVRAGVISWLSRVLILTPYAYIFIVRCIAPVARMIVLRAVRKTQPSESSSDFALQPQSSHYQC